MLTRIYNIKKSSGDSKVKPHFLSDKKMEGAIKHIVRKFPVVDCRSNSSTFEHVQGLQGEIIKSLSLYYYTFADLLELKDSIIGLLTAMDACQCQLDITLNYDLTTGYLNLVVHLITMMILLSRIEDRKAVLGLFNAAYDLQHGQSESSFPRLGQMILDYENPLKKLHEDLSPLNRLIFSALCSVNSVYQRRNKTADMWRASNMFSLTAAPAQLLYAAQTDTIACEYLSLDVIDRWIVFCGTVCHSTLLNDTNIFHMWQLALQMNMCLRLFRDETFIVHQEIQTFFESSKEKSKKVHDVKECLNVASLTSVAVHADRRRFLRSSLRDLSLLLRDQPGLLGPKVLYVWMALGAGRDEVLWLLRHQVEVPAISKKGSKLADELVDRQLPELLFYMLELRDLVYKHSGVINRYYMQYVTSYDSIVATEMVSHANGLLEEEGMLLSDFANSIGNLNSDTCFRGLRLDWYRFQAWTSVSRSHFQLSKNREFAVMMNTAVFHLKMIDMQEDMLRETSDLSIYCFYPKLAEKHWLNCLQLPAQARYVLSFARLAGHFTSALHDMCPEEKTFITEKALAQCNSVLEETCKQVSFVLERVAEHEFGLAYQMTPSAVAVRVVAEVVQQKWSGKAAAAAAAAAKDYFIAGEESYRVDRQALTMPDKLQTTLLELCAGLGAHRQILVANHIFAPRTYLSQALEAKFVDLLHAMMWEGQPQASNPKRPSDMLLALQAYMTVLQNLDTAISVDISNLMQSILLQQTQSTDAKGKDTITALYTKWYLEVLLRRASSGHMVWSEHLRTMLAAGQDQLSFLPDHYSDPQELRALVQIIGPYGIKLMSERLIWHVASQISEMGKIVSTYKEPLQVARSNFDNTERMKEVLNLLTAEPKDKKAANATCPADAILQRTIIIGQICAFRDALLEALRHVVESKLPFLQTSFESLYNNLDDVGKVRIGEMSAAMGVKGLVDMSLVNAIRAQNPNVHPGEHYNNSCLLLVAIAICIPRIGMSDLSSYKPSIQASLNNSHCVPAAVNTIGSALFHLHEQNDIQERMKEFLALASSGILRTIHERDGSRQVPDDILRAHTTLYIILEQMVRKNRWLSIDVLEACFPYNLVRTAYQQCYEADAQ
ncbi:unnamed protein product [Caenorhabditis sp. 36 PRJEB53466]|nr:unnamed protein product [Caenorhabditis sp. 36 PRJEB53466]